MWRCGIVFLGLMLVLLSGCGRRLVGMVEAEAGSDPVPTSLTWAALPGNPATTSNPTDTRNGIAIGNVAATLASSLNALGWTWITTPRTADVWVLVSWKTEGPFVAQTEPIYASPQIGMSTAFSVGSHGGVHWRRSRYPYGYRHYPVSRWGHRRGFYNAPRLMYAEPRIVTIYRRSLTLQAIKVSELPETVQSALLSPPNTNASPVPASKTPSVEEADLSQPPYAPPLVSSPEDSGIPPKAVLWSVTVISDGSRDTTLEVLPLLAAAAAESAGRTFISNVRVDDDLNVIFSNPSE